MVDYYCKCKAVAEFDNLFIGFVFVIVEFCKVKDYLLRNTYQVKSLCFIEVARVCSGCC